MGTIRIRTAVAVAGLLMPTLLWGAGELRADDACSTKSQAEAVIAAVAQGPELVMAVASVVPSDPSNCVPSFCAASEDEDDNTRVAIGAGISEAYGILKSEAKDDLARLVRVAACSSNCDRFVVTGFAASQGLPVSRMCDLGSAEGAADVRAPWDVGGGGGSGGVNAVSGN
jgi:hypothetical protein